MSCSCFVPLQCILALGNSCVRRPTPRRVDVLLPFYSCWTSWPSRLPTVCCRGIRRSVSHGDRRLTARGIDDACESEGVGKTFFALPHYSPPPHKLNLAGLGGSRTGRLARRTIRGTCDPCRPTHFELSSPPDRRRLLQPAKDAKREALVVRRSTGVARASVCHGSPPHPTRLHLACGQDTPSTRMPKHGQSNKLPWHSTPPVSGTNGDPSVGNASHRNHLGSFTTCVASAHLEFAALIMDLPSVRSPSFDITPSSLSTNDRVCRIFSRLSIE